jgi:hypothetical protein
MGWQYVIRDCDETDFEYWSRKLNNDSWTIIDGETTDNDDAENIFFGAIRYEKATPFLGKGYVSCLVILQSWELPDDKSHLNFQFEILDENTSLCNFGCPSHILDLLSPTTNEFASDWRIYNRKINAELDALDEQYSG